MSETSKPHSVPDLTNPLWFAVTYAAEQGMAADDINAAHDELYRVRSVDEQLEALRQERDELARLVAEAVAPEFQPPKVSSPASEPEDDRTMEEIMRDSGARYVSNQEREP